MKNVIVIGNGKMAIDCIKILMEKGVALPLVIYDPRHVWPTAHVADFCERHDIEGLPARNPNSKKALERVRSIGPDFIFNINSFRIIKEALLALPKIGTINFHNGPLPMFGGVNIPSWAIIEGVEQHGVTWHFVDAGIDTGDIVAQRRIPVGERETAIGLTFKCIVEGVDLFRELVDQLLAGSYRRTPQSGQSSYYGLSDVPNGGYVDFDWTFERLDRFVRGLDFRPFKNTFTYAKARFGEAEFIVNSISLRAAESPGGAPGQVLTIEHDAIVVAVRNGVIGIDEVMDADAEEIEIDELVGRCGIEPGDRLG